MARILVIDDDKVMLMWMRRILEPKGYEVETVLDSNEAISIQRKKPADLIITDILMPEKDGIEIITDLRREFPDVKIIAMSGGGRLEAMSYLETAKMLGAQGIYAKDDEENVLIDLIRKLLS